MRNNTALVLTTMQQQSRNHGRGRTRGSAGRNNADGHTPLPLRGPEEDTLAEAIEAITDHAVPGTPGVNVIETIQSAAGFPFSVGSRTVREASIKSGNPSHGAMRTDAHVSYYEIVLPIRELQYDEVDVDAIDLELAEGVHEPSCDGCASREAIFRYRASQHTVLSEVVCEQCDAVIHRHD